MLKNALIWRKEFGVEGLLLGVPELSDDVALVRRRLLRGATRVGFFVVFCASGTGSAMPWIVDGKYTIESCSLKHDQFSSRWSRIDQSLLQLLPLYLLYGFTLCYIDLSKCHLILS
ncbi:hypothetical protein OPV22_016367 [Ensete ventricosum]|uniref:Uncharacterized protein n=1 Tax=Ensete ventricosum TaxID=4639 RepID=A0AAV8QYH2_ENSVE|nr:hypothetical protein OPV22_016367 [Ensete ventricosum]